MENYIGKKVKGFKFESQKYFDYLPPMDTFIGIEGTIVGYQQDNNSFTVKFENPKVDYWSYPVSMVLKQLSENSLI